MQVEGSRLDLGPKVGPRRLSGAPSVSVGRRGDPIRRLKKVSKSTRRGPLRVPRAGCAWFHSTELPASGGGRTSVRPFAVPQSALGAVPSRSPTTGVVAVETLEEHPGRAPACRSVGPQAPVASAGSTARKKPVPVDDPGWVARSDDKRRRLAARPAVTKGALSRAAAPSPKAEPKARRPVVERRAHPPSRDLLFRHPGAQPGVRSVPRVKRESAVASARRSAGEARPPAPGPARASALLPGPRVVARPRTTSRWRGTTSARSSYGPTARRSRRARGRTR